MLKRITAFLGVLFMGLVLTVRSPVKADTFSIPFSAIPDLLNAFYTVAAGGKIEFSTLIGEATGFTDFVENLHNYYNEHYTQPLTQRTQGLINMGLSALALDGVDSITSINGLSIPITNSDIANFIGYDVNWVDIYNDVDNPVANPDPQFLTFINNINGSGFFFKDYSNYQYTNHNIRALQYYPPNSVTWCVYSAGGFNNPNTWIYPYCIPTISIDITSNNGVYSFSKNISSSDVLYQFYDGNGSNPMKSGVIYAGGFSYNGTNPNIRTNVSYSGSLGECLNQIALYFRNVNIYVDGELWSYVGDVINPGITLNDSVSVGDTGNITYPVYSLTSTGDIGLDMAKWGEYLFTKFRDGADTLSMDTVIEDGWDLVDTEDGERAITEEDEEDVAKVIHAFVDTTATTPTPTPDIGDPPVLKIIPPILELPDEIWPNGGRDTTVLAQMVHATDVAIPNDIMTVIWSTIGLLVVGGLISILHK